MTSPQEEQCQSYKEQCQLEPGLPGVAPKPGNHMKLSFAASLPPSLASIAQAPRGVGGGGDHTAVIDHAVRGAPQLTARLASRCLNQCSKVTLQ
eukprot:SAG31_NODE_1553_length_7905_cov_3.137330_6_plen_94_part_00